MTCEMHHKRCKIHCGGVESKQRRSMRSMDLRCFDVRMMQKHHRPIGERAGQLQFNCRSELIQII